MGGRGYAAGRVEGGLLSGRGLCCSAGEGWTAEWEGGAMLLSGRKVDC